MNSYIIIREKRIIIQEGWTSPQYQYLGIIMRIICFLMGIICFNNRSYPRKGLYLEQMFPRLSIKHIKKGIIKVKRDEQNNCFYSGVFGYTIY